MDLGDDGEKCLLTKKPRMVIFQTKHKSHKFFRLFGYYGNAWREFALLSEFGHKRSKRGVLGLQGILSFRLHYWVVILFCRR